MNFIDLIPNIVSGLEIKHPSIVLLHFWGENEGLEFLDKFTAEVAKAGGMNALFGGRNSSPFHMDLVFQPNNIEADNTVIIEHSQITI